MPERYQPTPEDRAPESSDLQTTNAEFLSDLEAKMDMPLTPAEQRSGVQAKRDTERIIDDSRPEISEPAEDTVNRIGESMSAEMAREQWQKLDESTKEIYNDSHKLYEEIAQEVLEKKGDQRLVTMAESAKIIIKQLATFYDDFVSETMDAPAFTSEVQKIYDRLVSIEAQISRFENREQ